MQQLMALQHALKGGPKHVVDTPCGTCTHSQPSEAMVTIWSIKLSDTGMCHCHCDTHRPAGPVLFEHMMLKGCGQPDAVPAAANLGLTLSLGWQAMVLIRRGRMQHDQESRERSHLLYLYEPLVKCVLSGEMRVRDTLQALLQLAGHELGLCSEIRRL